MPLWLESVDGYWSHFSDKPWEIIMTFTDIATFVCDSTINFSYHFQNMACRKTVKIWIDLFWSSFAYLDIIYCYCYCFIKVLSSIYKVSHHCPLCIIRRFISQGGIIMCLRHNIIIDSHIHLVIVFLSEHNEGKCIHGHEGAVYWL